MHQARCIHCRRIEESNALYDGEERQHAQGRINEARGIERLGRKRRLPD